MRAATAAAADDDGNDYTVAAAAAVDDNIHYRGQILAHPEQQKWRLLNNQTVRYLQTMSSTMITKDMILHNKQQCASQSINPVPGW